MKWTGKGRTENEKAQNRVRIDREKAKGEMGLKPKGEGRCKRAHSLRSGSGAVCEAGA